MVSPYLSGVCTIRVSRESLPLRGNGGFEKAKQGLDVARLIPTDSTTKHYRQDLRKDFGKTLARRGGRAQSSSAVPDGSEKEQIDGVRPLSHCTTDTGRMGRACEKQASRVNTQSGHGGRLRQSITRRSEERRVGKDRKAGGSRGVE